MLFTLRRNTFPRNASVYIFAMAVADFIKGVGFAAHVGPFLHQSLTESVAWCQGWGYVQSALRFSSIHLVTCICVDRCLVIWWGRYSEMMSTTKSVVVTATVFSVGVLVTVVPTLQGWSTVQFQLREGSCSFGVPQNELGLKTAVPAFFILIVIPLVTAVVANVLICRAMAIVGDSAVDSTRAVPDRIDQPRDQDQIELATVVATAPPRPGHSAWPDDDIQVAPESPVDKASTEETRGVTGTANDPMDPASLGPQEVHQTGCCGCSRIGSKSLIALVVVAFVLQAMMFIVKVYDGVVSPLDDDVYFALVWLSNSHAFANAIVYSVIHRTFHVSLVMDIVAVCRFLIRWCGSRVEPEIQPSTSI
ncbi:Hypp7161 [Branchiostoma lanceolatum]|uniref:Hypp7161 protein n=1 Tax=Branchiostoma lanceolatum TaxID=7740 RepID=A0A8J9YXZ0_BRALA|nr:Hypp7161 [Branchiostoma lanceolatum]